MMHTCKAKKSSGKLQFRNCHFVISGVLSLPTPHPTKTIVAVLYSSLHPNSSGHTEAWESISPTQVASDVEKRTVNRLSSITPEG